MFGHDVAEWASAFLSFLFSPVRRVVRAAHNNVLFKKLRFTLCSIICASVKPIDITLVVQLIPKTAAAALRLLKLKKRRLLLKV